MSESIPKRLVDVYPYTIFKHNNTRFLLLKRSSKKVYSHQWRMIGGKVKQGEAYWQAAYREFVEEIGLYPQIFWNIPSINQFYEYQSDTIYTIPTFAAQIDVRESDHINLDAEHDAYMWCSLNEVNRKVLWPEQRRLINLVDRIVSNNELLDDWIIPSNMLLSPNI